MELRNLYVNSIIPGLALDWESGLAAKETGGP